MVENYSAVTVNMDSEVWRDIKGYEGIYEVSNFGRVRQKVDLFSSGKKGKKEPKIINPDINYIQRYGYLRVSLYKNNSSKHFFVHRLVAEAFMPNPYNLPMVNHKDENRGNPRLDNLEWCTSKYNTNYGNAVLKSRLTRINNRNKSCGMRKQDLWNQYSL